MKQKQSNLWVTLAIFCLVCATLACGLGPGAEPKKSTATTPPDTPEPQTSPTETELPTATPTPTPTSPPLSAASATPEPPESPCAGLSGEIEVRVLVGPSEAVGLTPHAVGNIPFSVTTSEAPYLVQGSGPISYGDTLFESWGTYEVSLNLQITITGECLSDQGSGELDLVLEMSGNQMVEVTADGFHGEYPWSGTNSFDLLFPLVDGATVAGEGYSFVLHLQGQ